MTLFIDHVVITVNDINLSIDFYTNILGMELKSLHQLLIISKENHLSW